MYWGTLILFTVSTRNNVMNPEASDPVTPGQEKSITCDTGSANPANTMLWRKAGVEVTTGVGSQSTPGEYGGQRLGSSYTFTAQISDNGQVVSCIPVWQGTELTQHRQQVTIVVLCKLYLLSSHSLQNLHE